MTPDIRTKQADLLEFIDGVEDKLNFVRGYIAEERMEMAVSMLAFLATDIESASLRFADSDKPYMHVGKKFL